MTWYSTSSALFALSRYISVVLALYVAFALNLPNPWWAMLTVFLAQPTQPLVGAIWAKAAYRVAGTVIGVIASIVLIPSFANSAEVLVLALASWVAICLFGSLLDRSPRGYVFMLAGYTVALVGLPIATNPDGIFDVAVARAEEIIIGVLASAVVQSVLFPRSVSEAMQAKLDVIMNEARAWIGQGLRVLTPAPAPRHLAAELTALNLMATDWKFEGAYPGSARGALLALEERLVSLLPLMASIEDRLKGLPAADVEAQEIAPLLDRIAAWVATAETDDDPIGRLASEIRGRAPELGPTSSWSDILVASLVGRLSDLAATWEECLQLARIVRGHDPKPSQTMRHLLGGARPRRLHVDRGVAAFSALVIAVIVLCAGALTVATRWESGPIAIGIAAVTCSLFAAADDPTPMVLDFVIGIILALPLAVLYEFAILPMIDGFVMLAAVLFPVIFMAGLFLTQPKFALKTLAIVVGFSAGLALQPTFSSNFAVFTNTYIALVVGALLALIGLRLARILPAHRIIRRILRASWKELAALAASRAPPDRAAWASRMLDRAGLLPPRLARAGPSDEWDAVDALRDLRLGAGIIELRRLQSLAGAATSREIEGVLTALSAHFQALSLGRAAALPLNVVDRLDAAITGILRLREPADRQAGVAAATGLRRTLFPQAAAYRPGAAQQ